jgi:hypothetical protein
MCGLYHSTRSCDPLNRFRLKRELSIGLAFAANSLIHSACGTTAYARYII